MTPDYEIIGVPRDEGTKYDEGKAPLSLLSPYFKLEIAKVLALGAEKYDAYNWAKGLMYSRVMDALQRHLDAFWAGEDLDEEWGMHHLAHAGCCLMFLLHYEMMPDLYAAFDDRFDYGTIPHPTEDRYLGAEENRTAQVARNPT